MPGGKRLPVLFLLLGCSEDLGRRRMVLDHSGVSAEPGTSLPRLRHRSRSLGLVGLVSAA